MIYIQSGYAPDPDLNHARILYASHATGVMPTASTSATGHPAVAATYPTTFEYWQPTALPATWAVDLTTAKAVDAVGLYGDQIMLKIHVVAEAEHDIIALLTQRSAHF